MSLLVMGGVAAAFCLLRLADVIAALVVIRIIVQFLAQTIGVIVLRVRRPDLPRPFKIQQNPASADFHQLLNLLRCCEAITARREAIKFADELKRIERK